MSAESLADWRPPAEGITAANLYELPGLPLPPHTELIDGGLFFPTRKRGFHASMITALAAGLDAARPAGLLVRSQIALLLEPRTRVEPDLLVLTVDAGILAHASGQLAEIVRLVLEVVSPDSEIRDRELKPQLYAEAGIQHFWRAEEVAGAPVIQTYELDPATSRYFLTGTHQDRLTCTVPYPVDLALAGTPA